MLDGVVGPIAGRTAVLPPSAGNTPSEVHTLWAGSELGPLEWLCIHSWVRLDYRVVVHSYKNIALPPGVEWFDASRLMPAESLFRNPRNGSLAIFADVYRAMILKNFSTTWLDADIFLVRPLDLSAINILAKEGGNSVGNINNAIMKLSPDHPILDEILGRYNRPFKAIPWNKPGKAWRIIVRAIRSGRLGPSHLPWGALGGHAIQHVVSQNGFDGKILGPELCLTPFQVPIFQRVDDPDGALAEPIFYVHMYRSQLQVDLANPTPGSVYSRLWNIVGRDFGPKWKERPTVRDCCLQSSEGALVAAGA